MVCVSRIASLIDLHRGPITSLTISETDPPFLISASKDGSTCFTNLTDVTARFRLTSKGFFVTSFAWSCDHDTCFLGWNGSFVTEVRYTVATVSSIRSILYSRQLNQFWKNNLSLLSHINVTFEGSNDAFPSGNEKARGWVTTLACDPTGKYIVVGTGLTVEVYHRQHLSFGASRPCWARLATWDGQKYGTSEYRTQLHLVRCVRFLPGENLQVLAIFRGGHVW